MQQSSTYLFAGIENFRDFGSAHARGGLLFRSGHHAAASDRDLAELSQLGIATIVDLRRSAEREAQPSRRAPGFTGTVIVSDYGPAEGPHAAFLQAGDLSDAAIEKFLLDYYRGAPFEAAHLELFARAFAAMSRGPLLIHCMQGKDRTGLLAALILHALGVHPDEVMADFLETNRTMLTDEKIARMTAGLKAMTGQEPSPVAIRALLGVDAAHLETALAAIREQAGSIDAYLARLGVDRGALRAAAGV
jgi:protein tyrosine/serine phosphatase